MIDIFLFGMVLLVVGLVLAALAIFIGGKIMVVAGVTGLVIILVGVALVAGVFNPSTAQIAPNNNAPTVRVEDLTATTGFNTTVSTSNSLELSTVVSLNPAATGQSAILYPTGAHIHFTFQLARTDTNTSNAIFDVFGGNYMATNSTASSSDANVVYTTTAGVAYEDVNGHNASAQSAQLVSVNAASIVTVYVNLTLSGQAMLNLWNSGTGATTVSGVTFEDVSPFTIAEVAGQSISLSLQLVKS